MFRRLLVVMLAVMLIAAAGAAAAEETADGAEKDQPFVVQIRESDPPIAYVLVSAPNPIGFLPLPTEGEYTKTIRLTQPDGSETVNVVHLTPEGFWMEESNCEGHDCIEEGTVTLENRDERVLGSWVICLPHQLICELMTKEEAMSFLSR